MDKRSATSSGHLVVCLLVALATTAAPARAQIATHPLSGITPVDTDLNMNSRNITSLNYLLYNGGIIYSGSQGIPSADIAASAVTGAKIASGVITASKLSNPLGGSLNASTYYDSENSNYYLDAAGTSTSLSVAGNVILDNSKALQIKDTGGTARSVLTLDSAGQVILRNALGQTALNSVDGATYIYGSNGAGIIATFIDGKVGVNNTNPQYALDVNGSAKIRGPRLDIGSGSEVAGQIGGVNPWAGAGGLIFTTSGYWGGQYRFYSRPSGTETLAFTIDAADATGKILFGPNQDVNLYRSSANTLATDDSLNISGGVLISRDPNNFVTYSGPTTGGTGNYFFRSGVPGSYTDIMFIDGANARVGIRTSAPQQELEVVGDLNVTGTIYGSINTTGDVNCTGCVDTADIANSAVTSAKIANGAVTSSDLSNPLGGSLNATLYYDSDGSAYFLDPASTGNSLLVAGRIGLGTTSPEPKLHVVGGVDASLGSGTGYLVLGPVSGSNLVLDDNEIMARDSGAEAILHLQADGGPLLVHSNQGGGTQFAITDAGRVGIGTVSPNASLDIAGTVANLTLGTSGTAKQLNDWPSGWDKVISLSATGDLIRWAGPGAAIGIGVTADGIFRVLNNTRDDAAGTLDTDMLVVTPAGRVGINTSSPGYTLDVSGDIKTQDKFVVGVDNQDQINSDEAWLFRAADRPEGTLTVQLGGNSASDTKFEIVDRAWTKVIASISGEADENSFTIQPDGDSIFSGGNVGIGTNSPTNALNVIGDINATGNLYGTLGAGSVVGSTIATGAVSATKLANPLGGSVNGTAYYDSDNSNYFADFASSGTSLTTAGSVGIGTTSPLTSLHIPLTGIQIGTSGTVSDNFHLVSDTVSGNPRGLRVYNGNYGSGTHLLTVLSDGKIGLGNANPSVQLQLTSGSDEIGFNTDDGGIEITDTDDFQYIDFKDSTSDDFHNRIGSHTGDNFLEFYTNGVGRMVLDSSGNLNVSSLLITRKAAVYAGSGPGGGYPSGNFWYQYQDGNGDLHLGRNGWDPIVNYSRGGGAFNSVGFNVDRVGIGTVAPQTSLTVGSLGPGKSEATNKGTIQIASAGSSSATGGGGLEFKSSTAGTGYGWHIGAPDLLNGNVPLVFTYRKGDSAAWVEAMRIDNGGEVGIGTTEPVGRLHLQTAGGTYINMTASGTEIGSIVRPANTNDIRINSYDNLLLMPAQVDGGGNVGIGTTDPQGKLHINGATVNAVYLTGTVEPGIRINNTAYSTWDIFSGGGGAADYNNDLTFYNRAGSGGNVQFPHGNVGIGTLHPTAKLEVNGGVKLNTTDSKPTCVASQRGTMWFEQADDDLIYACMKNSTDHYNWVLVARGS